MPTLSQFIHDVLRALQSPRRPSGRPQQGIVPGGSSTATVPDDVEPGRSGPYATVDASVVDSVVTSYNPDTDGDPDPGEIVWTWVPYEENDGRGKDRPVLVVAREPGGTVLAVQLSSRDQHGRPDWVAVGSGGWDSERRPSWVDISRVLRVHPQGMRREAAALDRDRFDPVVDALRHRYGWS